MPKLVYSLVLFPNRPGSGHTVIFQVHDMDPRFSDAEFRASNGWTVCSVSYPELRIGAKLVALWGHRTESSRNIVFTTIRSEVSEEAKEIIREIHAALREWATTCTCFSEDEPPPPETLEVRESLLMADDDLSDEAEDEQDAPAPVDEFEPPIITI